jgi:carboxyl-terminal processing protease
MLKVIAQDVEKNFYDSELHGLDWKALTEETRQRINNAKSNSEMMTAIFLLVDKLQDSHTMFLAPSRAAQPLFGFEAKAFGDEIRIYQIKKNSAAANAGLQLGDRILAINGFPVERKGFDLMLLYYRRLRPVPGLNITYTRGSGQPQTVPVKAKIRQSGMMLDLTKDFNIWNLLAEYMDEERYDHAFLFDGDVGYVEVRDFATEEVGIIYKIPAAKAVIVDLRGNPGGYQDSVLELAGHFEPAPTSMGEWISRKKSEPLKIKFHKPNFSGPMVILVDSRSASAAEMFARHFQRTERAVVMGDHSSGRVNSSLYFSEALGTDRIVPFGVQISVGKVVFPGGEEVEKRGVTPDVTCIPTSEDLHEHRDPCLRQAVSLARKKLGLNEELPPKVQEAVDQLATTIAREKQERLDQQKD